MSEPGADGGDGFGGLGAVGAPALGHVGTAAAALPAQCRGCELDQVARRNAVDLVRRAVEAVGGPGGGGRPDMAQGGGPDGSKAAAALDAVRAALGEETVAA